MISAGILLASYHLAERLRFRHLDFNFIIGILNTLISTRHLWKPKRGAKFDGNKFLLISTGIIYLMIDLGFIIQAKKLKIL